MRQGTHQIRIRRERVDLFTFAFQPALLLLIYAFLFQMTQIGNFAMVIILTLVFVITTGFYVHYNFVRPRNEIVFEFEGHYMRVWEDENPYLDNVEYQIFEISNIWVENESFNHFFKHGKKLYCLHGGAELTILDLKSFLFGGINDADLEEVINYLRTINVQIRIGVG